MQLCLQMATVCPAAVFAIKLQSVDIHRRSNNYLTAL